jgi:hypothetical protein
VIAATTRRAPDLATSAPYFFSLSASTRLKMAPGFTHFADRLRGLTTVTSIITWSSVHTASMSGPDAWGFSFLRAAGSRVHPSACACHSTALTSSPQPLHLTVLMKRGSVTEHATPFTLAVIFSASFSCA